MGVGSSGLPLLARAVISTRQLTNPSKSVRGIPKPRRGKRWSRLADAPLQWAHRVKRTLSPPPKLLKRAAHTIFPNATCLTWGNRKVRATCLIISRRRRSCFLTRQGDESPSARRRMKWSSSIRNLCVRCAPVPFLFRGSLAMASYHSADAWRKIAQ